MFVETVFLFRNTLLWGSIIHIIIEWIHQLLSNPMVRILSRRLFLRNCSFMWYYDKSDSNPHCYINSYGDCREFAAVFHFGECNQ